MTDTPETPPAPDQTASPLDEQMKLASALFAPFAHGGTGFAPADMMRWSEVAARLQTLWMEYQAEQMARPEALAQMLDPARWMTLATSWYNQMPLAQAEQQKALWDEGMRLWEQVLGQYGLGPKAG